MNMVSLIVPIYNSEKYLPRCVNSLLQQTMGDIEIILVDDGSTDSSKIICDEFAAVDKRIKVIHQPNSGASVARNTGMRAAKGEYITFVDSDDYVDAEYIKTMYDAIKRTESDLVITGRTQLKLDGSENVIKPPTLTMHNDDIRELFIDNRFDYVRGGPCCKIYKGSIVEEHGLSFPENIHYLEDAIFVLEYILCCTVISSIEESHYYYELHEGSLVFSVHSPEIELNGYNSFQRVFQSFKEKYGLSFDESYWFISNLDFMQHRQLKAIYNETSTMARINGFKLFDWADYREFNARRGIKWSVIKVLSYSTLGRLLLSYLKVT